MSTRNLGQGEERSVFVLVLLLVPARSCSCSLGTIGTHGDSLRVSRRPASLVSLIFDSEQIPG